MGRGVSRPRDAVAYVYDDVTDLMDEFDWDMYKEDIVYKAQELFPSMVECNEWRGKEDLALLKNNHAYIGVSEYCGCVCIWLETKGEDYLNTGYGDAKMAALADAWCNKVKDKFESNFGTLRKVATFSNGESVYERK